MPLTLNDLPSQWMTCFPLITIHCFEIELNLPSVPCHEGHEMMVILNVLPTQLSRVWIWLALSFDLTQIVLFILQT